MASRVAGDSQEGALLARQSLGMEDDFHDSNYHRS